MGVLDDVGSFVRARRSKVWQRIDGEEWRKRKEGFRMCLIGGNCEEHGEGKGRAVDARNRREGTLTYRTTRNILM